MNKLLVVGSVAYDDIETPDIKDKRVLGGSATFFSTAVPLRSAASTSSRKALRLTILRAMRHRLVLGPGIAGGRPAQTKDETANPRLPIR